MKWIIAIAVLLALWFIIKHPVISILIVVAAVALFVLHLVLKKRKKDTTEAKMEEPEVPVIHYSESVPLVAVEENPKTVVAVKQEQPKAPVIEYPENAAPAAEDEKPKYIITDYPVKGVFAHEDEIFHNLMEINPVYEYTKSELIESFMSDSPVYKWIPKQLPAELIPEPENKYDPNAIRVVIGGITIGYVPKESCIKVLDIINSGRLDNVAYEIAGGAFKLLEEDYDPIKDKSSYSLETGRGELYAKIYIREIIEN